MISEYELYLLAIPVIKDCALEIFYRNDLLQYESACQQIDKSNLPEQDKEMRKNTHYVLLSIKTQMLQNKDHICSIEMNSDGVFLCGEMNSDGVFLCGEMNSNLLCQLCDENGINVVNIEEDGSMKLHFYINYINYIKEKKKTMT